ncbi:hypothetical protein CL176_10115 [Suicoccus acidiformans]|uniref:PPM-type phosphatase domain-containing protein n=1 Tax=Suicoccus acidiformans TaxID=2036206 RepID=A0A347WML5_9LACT|nr:protein phosphatase 2C domain-containing protein [Suicoccus acidiformans]AXY26322.1 hypothetical protein CL176_10115 [Suicoccus acidiformans]
MEAFIQGKASPELCEDALIQTQDYIAVIDGVTAKSNFTYQGHKTGWLMAQLVKKVLERLEPAADFQAFLQAVNQEVRAFYQKVDFTEDIKLFGLQAVGAIYSNHRREIWLVGDCQVMVDGKRYQQTKLSDDVLEGLRSLVIHLSSEDESDVQEARSVIEPWIVQSTQFANDPTTPFGYAVFNGEEIPLDLVQIIPLTDASHEVILATDGYPQLEETLEASEAYLAQVLAEDPLLYRQEFSTKGLQAGNHSFDDRTYIRFKVKEI